MCNMDCLNCEYKDCKNNKMTDAERHAQNQYDNECKKERTSEERHNMKKGRRLVIYDYNHTDKAAACREKYEQTEKAKARRQRYAQSEKGKAAQKRYAQSEKGREAQKRNTQRQIASGKNKEYCKAYYQRKKAEREAAKNGV